jgi:thymidylate synthase
MSADLFLGVPFNWIGQSVLQMMLAHVCGLELGQMVWVGADVHVYSNHLEQVDEVLKRIPKERPILKIINKRESLNDFIIDDFVLEGYDPHPAIKGDVAI